MATTEVDLTGKAGAAMLERVVLGGDLSKLSSQERMLYYRELCHSLKLNPLTQPFQYLSLSGKLVLYARKDATEQLRKQHGVSITKLEAQTTEGVYIVTATAKDQTGREDVATGAVAIENLKGEMKANAMLKAETKAKRRVTLSLCGLGMLDETEVETIPGAQVVPLGVEEPATEPEAAPLFPDEPLAPDALPELDLETQRTLLLSQIKGCADKLKLKAPDRANLWTRYVGGDPQKADPAALQDLLEHLRNELGK
jgi:hypothetical protein